MAYTIDIVSYHARAVLSHPNAINASAMWYNIEKPSDVTSILGTANLVRRSAVSSIPDASGIYRIVCLPTRKIYIGSSINLRVRRNGHLSELRMGTHVNRYLQRAWNKYGEQSFVFEVIELILEPCLTEREQYWIDRLKACDPKKGFNLSPKAGSTLGIKLSDEHRRQISLRQLGKKRGPHSAEHRAALSAGIRAAYQKNPRPKLTPEQKARLVATRGKDWVVTSPSGEVYAIRNLAVFCREHKLNRGMMVLVAQGRYEQYKGWKCRYQ